MKKLLILMLVLGMASWANAGLINVVTDGEGSNGHAGTEADPLDESETIGIKIVLPVGISQGFNLDLHVSGPGILGETGAGPGVTGMLGNHVDDGMMGMFWVYSGIAQNAIANMADVSMGQMTGDLVWALEIHCDGIEDVIVSLTLAGDTEVDGVLITEADLGDLVIYQVPEPMTIALLGLGSLFLLRRRK